MPNKPKRPSPTVRRNLVSLVSEPFGLGIAKALANPQWRLSSREPQPLLPPKKSEKKEGKRR
jgi:hypothetical protein